MTKDWFINWTVTFGDIKLVDVTATEARLFIQDKLDSGIDVTAMTTKHCGREVAVWIVGNKTSGYKAALLGPDLRINYIT